MTALRLGFVGRLSVIITAVILSFAILVVTLSAAPYPLTPNFYTMQWRNGGGDYLGYTYGSDLSSLSYGNTGGYYLTFGSNNIGTIPLPGSCTDVYIGNTFSWLDNGNTSPWQPYYSYTVNYVITARYSSSSTRNTFNWGAVTVSSVLSSVTNQQLSDSSTDYPLADFDYVGLLTDTSNYTDSSFAPATFCTDYTFSVIFRLPGYYDPDTLKTNLVTDFHFPITAFTGAPPSNSNYIFLKGNSITATYDAAGSETADAVERIVTNALAIGAIAHRDAQDILSKIEAFKSQAHSDAQDIDNSIDSAAAQAHSDAQDIDNSIDSAAAQAHSDAQDIDNSIDSAAAQAHSDAQDIDNSIDSAAAQAHSDAQDIDNSIDSAAAQAHSDAQNIDNSIDSAAVQAHQDMQDLQGVIEGNGSYGSPESQYSQDLDGFEAAESDFFGDIGFDTYMSPDYVDQMFNELDWDNIEVPNRRGAEIFHISVNPIFDLFPIFVVFPVFIGLVATFLGRRRA